MLDMAIHTGMGDWIVDRGEQQPEGHDVGIATRIRAARHAARLTQEEAAEKLGITPGYLGHMESRKRGVPFRRIRDMARVYNVDEYYLLTGRQLDSLAEDEALAQILAYASTLSPDGRDRLLKMVTAWVEAIGGTHSEAGSAAQQ